ncbi:MAG: MFS transporter, partial [Acidimicrobiales bacterium]|nr:MFS transporter [Acidimicrobiales bacterium]
MPLPLTEAQRPIGATASGHRPGTLRHRLTHPTVFLAVILTAQLMVVLDTTIVNVALPHIQRSLALSGSGLSWVINAYILTFGGLLLLGARAGDLLGRRRIFLTGIALFAASSLVGGLATSGWMLLAARAAQGIGAALAAPSALSLLTTVFPEGPGRVRAIALYTTVSAAGAATGLVLGGLLTELVSWRWVMFVNVPIGVAVFVVGRLAIVETERRRGRFDLVGALTSTIGMGAVVLGLVEAGSSGWTAPVTVVSFLVGLSLLAMFVATERRAEEPVLPLRLLADATRSTANASRGLVYAGMYGMFFFLSLFFQDVQHLTPLRAGLAFLPIPASVFLSSQLASRVLVGRLPQKTVMLTSIALATLSLALGTQITVSSSY